MVKLKEGWTKERIIRENEGKKFEETILKSKEIQGKFIDITKKFFGWGFWRSRVSIEDSHNPDFRDTLINILPLHKGEPSLYIHLGPIYNQNEKNYIVVHSQEYLDEALKLAQTYEEAGFSEFTVTKGYRNNL